MSGFEAIVEDVFEGGSLISAVLTKPVEGRAGGVARVGVRPVRVRGELRYQFAERRSARERHENLTAGEAARKLIQLIGPSFAHCHLYTTDADYTVRAKSDGALHVKSGPPTKRPVPARHDRQKQRLIPEGVACPFLVEIGVMTRDGRVKRRRYDKFRQVNRFLELVDDVLDELPAEGRLNVVDFGCGRSYLTFALHHLLACIRRRDVHIAGLDRNREIVEDCRGVAQRLGLAEIEFQHGDIADYDARGPVHLAVSLHACDTATDDALAKAVGWRTDVILAVPCCQHELNAAAQPDEALSAITRHGLLKERLAALATDALRAEALEICGYATQVVEFIDMEHTAKNVLIRAARRRPGAALDRNRVASYLQLRRLFGIEQLHLEKKLGPEFQSAISAALSQPGQAATKGRQKD